MYALGKPPRDGETARPPRSKRRPAPSASGRGDEELYADLGGGGGGGGVDDDDDDDGDDGDDEDEDRGGGPSDLDGDLLDRDDERGLTGVVDTYSYGRNMFLDGDFSNDFQIPKPILEYVNIKYVEDNFRTVGLTRRFPRNSIPEAIVEVKAMENWCYNKKCSISGKEYIRGLCIPLFCHVYMSIYQLNTHEEMILFLKRFEHLFLNKAGSKLIRELESITDLNNLPPTLDILRRNKLVYSCSPKFLNNFCKLLHRNYILKGVFQEFFEVQFDSCENSFEIVNGYFIRSVQKVKNNLTVNDKRTTTQTCNISDASNNISSNLEPNSSQNNNPSVNDATSNNIDDQRPSTSKDYQESRPSQNQPISNKEMLLSSDGENEKPQEKHQLVGNLEVNKKSNNQENQPSKNQPKVLSQNKLLNDSDNDKSQRKHQIIEIPEVNKSLDDQQSSASKEQSKVVNLLSSDSENEMPQKNHELVKKPEVDKGLVNQLPSTSREFHQEPEPNKDQLNVIDLLSSDSENEMSQTKSPPVENPKVDKSMDDQRPSTSKDFQSSQRQESDIKDQSKATNVISLSSSDSDYEKKPLTLKKNQRIKKKIDKGDECSDYSSEDSEQKSKRSKKKYVKRKHTSQDGNRSSPNEQKSRNKKIRSRKKNDFLNVQNRSTSDEENAHERELKSSDPLINERYTIRRTKPHRISFVYKGDKQDNKHQSSEHINLNNDLNCETELLTQQNTSHFKDHKKRRSPIKSSFQDSSEDSSGDSYCSRYSFHDEEATLHSYFRKRNQPDEFVQKKTSRLMKHKNVTKIDLENNDEDLCSTRQITITNCNKLSCSILSSNHKYVVAGSMDSLIYVWERSDISYVMDIQNKIENNTHSTSQNKNLVEYLDKSDAKILRGHGGSIFDLAEIAAANILLSASYDKTFRAWDLRTKRCLEVFSEHEHRIWCIAASPFSLQVITGSCEGASCLWFLKYKRPLRFFVGHIDDVLVVKFHPNQVLIATGSSDKTIRIFEVTSGECTRLLVGHSDNITCLEFHPTVSSFLASASANGEIFLWNIGISSIIWKLRVGNVLVSDIAWFTEQIILASLTSGVILKCDTREDYMESSKSVKGYTTKLDRLMTLKVYDSIVYTIGIPSKTSIQKVSSVKQQTKTENDSQLQEQKSHRELSSSPKLFFPQPTFENNSNSIRPLRRTSSTIINHSPVDFLKMDLHNTPFHVNPTEFTRLSSESNNMRLIHSPCTKSSTPLTLIKSELLLNHQNDVQGANTNSSQINVQSINAQSLQQNVQSTSLNVLQQTHVSLQSQIPNVQHILGKNNPTMNKNFQHLHLQNNIHITSTNIQQQQQQQQVSQLQSVIHPRITTQLLQKNSLQPEQQLQLQQSVGSNFQLANTNIMQQPVFQQLRPNTLLTKVNVQQLKSPQQTSIRLANMSIPQSFSENIPRTGPQILAIRQQKSKMSQPSLENSEEDARLRQVVMASLLENNPEMFSRGQTVIGEITRSQSTTQPFNTIAPNSLTESQLNENH